MNVSDIDTGELAREVESLEREWMQAWLRKDMDTCRRILDDNFILTSATGALMDKEEWLAKAAGPFTGREFHWKYIKVRKISDTVAIAHVRSSQVSSIGEKDWSGEFLITDVWVKRADGWKVTARQGLGPLASS